MDNQTSLRDKFAMAVLPGIWQAAHAKWDEMDAVDDWGDHLIDIAYDAYAIADAMMKERTTDYTERFTYVGIVPFVDVTLG